MITKSFRIMVHPKSGICHTFVALGETQNHALAELSLSLRQGLIICNARLKGGDLTDAQYVERDIKNYKEILRCIRKPGRYCKTDYNLPNPGWIKVKVKEITKAITVAYVKEVWLGRGI